MKAITVRQPWAWAIAHAGKDIENRSGNTRYRGPIAIHAGKQRSARGAVDPRVLASARRLDVWLDRLPLGAIIAVAELVDVHPDADCCRPWGESTYVEGGGRLRRMVHHLVLEDIRPLDKPVSCDGALGLWNVPADVAVHLASQGAAA